MYYITWLSEIFCNYLLVLQVESYKTKRDLKKIKRHPDSVDISNISKDMEKSKLELEKGQSDDMEIEGHSSKKDESSLRHSKHKAIISGPSSW